MLASITVRNLPSTISARRRRADQQGLHRPPLLLAGAEVDRRVEGAGQRHHHQQEREDPAQTLPPSSCAVATSTALTWIGSV